MNTKSARKMLTHRVSDVLACLKWKRYIRLHLASNLLTGLCMRIRCLGHDSVERGLMDDMLAAILKKDANALREVFQAWEKVVAGKNVGVLKYERVNVKSDGSTERTLERITTHEIVDNGVNMMGDSK
jgi:hypothetical protein